VNKTIRRDFLIMKKKIFAVALAAAMTVSSAFTAFAVETADSITGDLTVTTFFNEKTDAVELKSGDSYTFTFNDKSNGTNNWENYVMAVVGAEGDAYTGADQEILIVRADAWGWGGSMSDFVAPDATGNALVFNSDVNWDNWAADTAAGVDCEVTIARNGDTLDYTAKIGSYTVSTSATSGVALPDSCYVFFTGENCDLTGFATTTSGSDVSADTTEATTEAAADTTEATTEAATEAAASTATTTTGTTTTLQQATLLLMQ
jgi:hypothetical protein